MGGAVIANCGHGASFSGGIPPRVSDDAFSPLPLRPSVVLRSKPAAVCFKAAIAPRGGRSSLSHIINPRPAQGCTPLGRRPMTLAMAAPDP